MNRASSNAAAWSVGQEGERRDTCDWCPLILHRRRTMRNMRRCFYAVPSTDMYYCSAINAAHAPQRSFHRRIPHRGCQSCSCIFSTRIPVNIFSIYIPMEINSRPVSCLSLNYNYDVCFFIINAKHCHVYILSDEKKSRVY